MNVFFQYHKNIVNQKMKNIKTNIQCSFEFFPPKNKILEEKIWSVVEKLNTLNPHFFSVTYGANSGERENTYKTVKKIQETTGVATAAHMTCINSTSIELKTIAQYYWDNGIKNIVALRGDNLDKNCSYEMCALDLVILLKKIADFDISVAAYPELHPESKSSKSDIVYLKKKIDAGANRAITQFFFNIESYLRFRDNCIKYGINVDIIPGILPVYSFKQLRRFAHMTNVNIPRWMYDIFNELDDDLVTQKIIGSSITINMVKELLCEGVKNFHFYTLNQSDIIYAVCRMLGL